MTANGSTIISIVLTALGALGLPITILLIFFEVKPSGKKKVSVREMVFILMWMALLVLGIVNLYFGFITGKENGDNQGGNAVDDDASQSYDPGGEDDPSLEDTELSPEEVIIKQNYDVIHRLKEEYSDTDIEVIKSESNSVTIDISENAGYIFGNLLKAGESYALNGSSVPDAQVIILDYSSDEILCVLTSDEYGMIHYSPGNQNIFYCIVFHNDFNIYVSPPLQVLPGEIGGFFQISLEGKDSKYTPLYQIRIYARDSNTDMSYSFASPEHEVRFFFEPVVPDGKMRGGGYITPVDKYGILSWSELTYFTLNSKYVMEISLSGGGTSNLKSDRQKIVGATANSNIVDVYFDFYSEAESE